jgi:hypothetical protein
MKQRLPWRSHRLYGVNLTGDFPFTACLEIGEGSADLTVTLSQNAPELIPFKAAPPIYQSLKRTQSGASLCSLYRLQPYEVLSFPELADFYLQSEQIACHPQALELDPFVEIRLLGPVLSYWLERRGLLTLHASAVDAGGQAVAFLSSQRGGKTGLAAALMRAGHPLLTDDILPIEERDGIFLGRPGYPQMRMWPDEAGYFLGAFEDLDRVHPTVSKRRVPIGSGRFGAFHGSSLPLACLYLPERREGGSIEIREISPRDAFIELVRHSFSPNLVEAAGLQAGRMEIFARLVTRIPVRRLLYPSGFEHLEQVAETILRDL